MAYPIHDDRYRSLPGTPFAYDARDLAHGEILEALEHARLGVDGPDYFSAGRGYGAPVPVRPRSPYLVPRVDAEHHEFHLNDLVRRTNLAVTLANSSVSGNARFANIHPMMCSDGRFPSDFQTPKTFDQIKMLDNTQLDRILQAYRLPYDSRPVPSAIGPQPRDLPFGPRQQNFNKLMILLEFLGACRVMDREMWKAKKDRQWSPPLGAP